MTTSPTCAAVIAAVAFVVPLIRRSSRLKVADRDGLMTQSLLPVKLRAVGFGIFIPYFFVTTGVSLDLTALTRHGEVLARLPLFLVALVLARALPALDEPQFGRNVTAT